MEFAEVVRRRRMVRAFDPARPVPTEVLTRVLSNARRAPSAGYTQGWDFVVLTSRQERDDYWAVTTELDEPPDSWLRGVRTAPVLILCCSDKSAYLRRYAEPDKGWTDLDEARWPAPYWDIDTGMAALLMLLTAVDEGLGGLFFGAPPEFHDDVFERFGIPHDRSLIGVVAIGYAEPSPPGSTASHPRRELDEIAHWGCFGEHTPPAAAAGRLTPSPPPA